MPTTRLPTAARCCSLTNSRDVAQQYPGIGRQADQRSGTASAAAQAPAADGPVIRRAPKGKKDTGKDKPVPKGTLDTTKHTLEIDELPVPDWKAVTPYSAPPLQWRKADEKRPGDQRSIWLSDPGLRSQAAAGVKRRITELKLGSPPYYLQGHAAKGKSGFVFVGSEQDIGAAIVIPPWDRGLAFHRFDVDHMKEWQLGGDNTLANMWLLDSSLNRSSGSTIMNSIRDQVGTFLADPALVDPPSLEDVHAKYTVTFRRPVPVSTKAPKPDDSWARDDIGKSEHVSGLERVPDHALADVKGTPERLVIYRRAGGGQVRRIPLHGRTGNVTGWRGRGFRISSVTWGLDGASPGSGPVGKIIGTVLKDNQIVQGADLEVDIMGMTGVDYGGFVDPEAISRMRRAIIAKFASPIEFPDVDFDLDQGLVGRGVIPENPQSASWRTSRSPSCWTAARSASRRRSPHRSSSCRAVQDDRRRPYPRRHGQRPSVTGRVDFEIEGLAKGYISGTKTTAPGFSLEGALDFDTKMFTEAHLGLSYRDGHFGVQGHLAVGPGKISASGPPRRRSRSRTRRWPRAGPSRRRCAASSAVSSASSTTRRPGSRSPDRSSSRPGCRACAAGRSRAASPSAATGQGTAWPGTSPCSPRSPASPPTSTGTTRTGRSWSRRTSDSSGGCWTARSTSG